MESEHKVSIGIPVYNGEKYLRKRLDSIINQTFTNYEIIISDNASIDSTSKICEEYIKKCPKIKYIRQKINFGAIHNFNFLINEAKGEYYIAAAVDDLWEPTFLEKNVKVLDTQKNIVGSISEIDFFGYEKQPKINPYIAALKRVVRKQDSEPLYNHVLSVSGDYKRKAALYLRFNQGSFLYGLFRKDKLLKRVIRPIGSWDLVVILNALKEGDLYVIDEILMHKFAGGESSKGSLHAHKFHDLPFWDLILPSSTLAFWCIRNIGIKFYFKNIDWFILLTLYGWYTILLEIVRKWLFVVF